MTTGAMYLLASTIELCMMNNHITSVAFSNKRYLLVLLELRGSQLGSFVDLGWAHSHICGWLFLAGASRARRAMQLHYLYLLSSHRLAQACVPSGGRGVRASGDTQGLLGSMLEPVHHILSAKASPWPAQIQGGGKQISPL